MVKKFCLLLLAMAPVASVSFAAKSALSVDQIRRGNASDAQLSDSGPKSGIRPPGSDVRNRN
jgi:hypothetical protein